MLTRLVDKLATRLPERKPRMMMPETIETQLASFGVRLRELRRQRGWTLQEVACRGGFSKAFLSRLESGGRQASIAAVLTLARIFGVSLSALFESRPANESCVIVRAADAVEQTINGLRYIPLSNAGRFYNLQPLHIRVSPWRRGQEHYHHDGEEWVYVLSGLLTLSLAGKTFDLERGDAAHFESRLPHRLIARGKADAEVLVVASPVSSPAVSNWAPARQHRAIPVMNRLNFQPQTPVRPRGRAGRREAADPTVLKTNNKKRKMP